MRTTDQNACAAAIKSAFYQSNSVQTLEIPILETDQALVLFIQEIVDQNKLHALIVDPLTRFRLAKQSYPTESVTTWLKDGTPLPNATVEQIKREMMNGQAVVLLKDEQPVLIDCAMWNVRSVSVPLTSSVYEGPASALTESLDVNMNLLRNYFRSPELAIETLEVGENAAKKMAIVSLHGKTNPDLVKEVRERLKQVHVAEFIISQIATDALEGKGFLFPRTMANDRPDACALALAKGKIVLLVEGSPLAILAPSLFFHFFQNQDDYLSEFGRFGARPLRYLYFFIATFFPAITVAIIRFHLDHIPTEVANQLVKTHETLAPYTIELVFVILLLQLIMDGSYRLPGNTIFAVTFIGTMLISDIATNVSLFHPITIVVIGVCYITSFPVLNRGLLSPIFFIRITLIIVAHFFGFAGMFAVTTAVIIHMAHLRSLGIPYLYPFIPFQPDKWHDTIFRPTLTMAINKPTPLPFKKAEAAQNRRGSY